MQKFKVTYFLFSHYKVLKVPDDASQLEIKNSYLDLVKRHHPDVGEISSEQFVKVRQAYETLKDPELRKQYDRELAIQMRKDTNERRSYYAQNDDDFFQQDRARTINIRGLINGIIRLVFVATGVYIVLHYIKPMSQHQLRRQNIFLANQNIDSSPSAQEARRKQYAQQMKDKKFTAQVIEVRVSNGSQPTTRAKQGKKTSIQSIPGICKEQNAVARMDTKADEYM